MLDTLRRTATVMLFSAACLLPPGLVLAGDPGRLEADAEFLLGSWANDCARGGARIFLSDGALRQEGLLRLAREDGSLATPVTLLAATRDGVGVSLESRARLDDTTASSRFLARVVSDQELSVKSMTLCRGKRCETTRMDLTWKRCEAGG